MQLSFHPSTFIFFFAPSEKTHRIIKNPRATDKKEIKATITFRRVAPSYKMLVIGTNRELSGFSRLSGRGRMDGSWTESDLDVATGLAFDISEDSPKHCRSNECSINFENAFCGALKRRKMSAYQCVSSRKGSLNGKGLRHDWNERIEQKVREKLEN